MGYNMFKKLVSIILRFYRPEFNDGGSIIPKLNQSRFNQSRRKGTVQDGRVSRGGNSSIVSCGGATGDDGQKSSRQGVEPMIAMLMLMHKEM